MNSTIAGTFITFAVAIFHLALRDPAYEHDGLIIGFLILLLAAENIIFLVGMIILYLRHDRYYH